MKKLSDEQIAKAAETKLQLRCLVSNVYELQKLRIGVGNRLVQSFYIQLGMTPNQTVSDDDAENDRKKQSMIKRLKFDYNRITDSIVGVDSEKKLSVKSAIKKLNSGKPEDCLEVIRDEADYKLVESYMLLLKAEEETTKVIAQYVESHPLWDAFFKDIKGCGPLMAACCIAYLDINKAQYPSSFYRYCGLDTVQDVDKDGNTIYLKKVDGVVTAEKVRQRYIYLSDDTGEQYFGDDLKVTTDFNVDGDLLYANKAGELFTRVDETRNINGQECLVFEELDGGAEYIGDVVVSEHGRRKGDTVLVEYYDREGNKVMDGDKPALKRSLTYNPFIKTKLMGVLTGCLIKAKDPTYKTIYDNRKSMYEKSARHKDYTPGRRAKMAERYMIKMFLRNLHTTWRVLEGLPVFEPYEVEKLGNRPHHLNDYQHEMAQKWAQDGHY